ESTFPPGEDEAWAKPRVTVPLGTAARAESTPAPSPMPAPASMVADLEVATDVMHAEDFYAQLGQAPPKAQPAPAPFKIPSAPIKLRPERGSSGLNLVPKPEAVPSRAASKAAAAVITEPELDDPF